MIHSRPNHVFVSYLRENKTVVDRLCNGLSARGVKVWLDRDEIAPGSRWSAIRTAIQDGQYFIACFSKEYASRARTYMNEELVLAIDELRQRAPHRAWFIPVLLSECDVPARSIGGAETLLDIQWVTLYADWDRGMKHILDLIDPVSSEAQTLQSALLHPYLRWISSAINQLSLR